MTHVYLSFTFREDEFKAMRATHHQHILLSYALNGHKPIKTLFKEIGYRPESIMIDPGAITYMGRGVNTGVHDVLDAYKGDGYFIRETANILLDEVSWMTDMHEPMPIHYYIRYLLENQGDYDWVLTFDQIRANYSTLYFYQVMRAMGFPAVPVYHYNVYRNDENWKYLNRYVKDGNELIALGGTIAEPSWIKRVEWVRECINRFPGQKFHLLGSQNEYILDQLPELYSSDGNKWKLTPSFSKSRKEGQTKVEGMIEQVERIQRKYGQNLQIV